jgi:uncharacterized protein (TIGR02996 family)
MSKRDEDRTRFERAIADDPRDMAVRKIYADWLEEFGTDADADYAVVQRSWTVEKQDAIEGLTHYAEQCEMSYERLIAVASAYLDAGEYVTLPFNTPDVVYDDPAKFWEWFALATGRSVDDDEKGNTFIGCAC